MTKQAEHVKHRRARGLCGVEGCREKSGDDFRCPGHKVKHAESEKARYWRRKVQVAA